MTLRELVNLIKSDNYTLNVETADGYKLTPKGKYDSLDEEIEHIYLDGLTIDLKKNAEDIFPNATIETEGDK